MVFRKGKLICFWGLDVVMYDVVLVIVVVGVLLFVWLVGMESWMVKSELFCGF